MRRVAGRAWPTRMQRDPDVVGRRLGGRGRPLQPDGQHRAAHDRAEAARASARPVRRRSSPGCRALVTRHPGRHGDVPVRAGRADHHAHQPRAVPVQPHGHRAPPRSTRVGRTGSPRRLGREPELREVASEAQDGGARLFVQDRPREGRAARRVGAGGQRRAEQRLRPAPDLDHLRPVEPVPRDPGGAAALPAGHGVAGRSSTSPRRGGAQVPLRSFADGEPHHRAAGHRPRRAVPGRHRELQPRPGRLARRGRARHRGRSSATSECPTRVIGRYHGRRGGVRALAGGPALADPRGRGDDLHRAGRALRERDPSADDPVDAALRRRRRAAGAACCAGSTCR